MIMGVVSRCNHLSLDSKKPKISGDIVLQLPMGITMTLKEIPVGSFMMGSPIGEDGRSESETLHRVTLKHKFWLGEFEVTQAQYKAVMGINRSHFKGSDYPVDNVTWLDAMRFCRRLTEQERAAGRLPEDYEYSLPTQAQWEYACRAGTITAWHFGEDMDSTQANFEGRYPGGNASKGPYLQRPARVGSYEPNAWGLYDMHGNVWEWCSDRVPDENQADPEFPGLSLFSGLFGVIRGGGWNCTAEICRSAHCYNSLMTYGDSNIGFRVALVPEYSYYVWEPFEKEDEVSESSKAVAINPKTGKMEDMVLDLDGVFMRLKPVPKGSFTNTVINKKFKLKHDYWLGETEVTQAQYEVIMNEKNDSKFEKGGNYPAENVSWMTAMTFCKKLTERERNAGRLPEGYVYTLPTEAQWEHAARGGRDEGYEYSGDDDLNTVGWYYENSGKKRLDESEWDEKTVFSNKGTIHPVGKKMPNSLGLYDMNGNVYEWCRDVYDLFWRHDPETLKGMRVIDALFDFRVYRGGSWFEDSSRCRTSFRDRCNCKRTPIPGCGFRVALVPVQ